MYPIPIRKCRSRKQPLSHICGSSSAPHCRKYNSGTTQGSCIVLALLWCSVQNVWLKILTAIAVARKDKMDYNIATAMDSTIQIALMVTPVTVLVGWIVQSDMSLFFEIFPTAILFITVLYVPVVHPWTNGSVVSYLIQDGRSNYLGGGLLISLYVVSSFERVYSYWRFLQLRYGFIQINDTTRCWIL